MATNHSSKVSLKSIWSHASGFVVYVLQLTIMYQSHQVLDSLCSLSLLAPWLPQLTQTVNEVHKTTRLVSAIVDIQQCTPSKKEYISKHTGSLTANCSSRQNKSSQLLSHFRSLWKTNQKKLDATKPKHATEFTNMYIYYTCGTDVASCSLNVAVKFWILLMIPQVFNLKEEDVMMSFYTCKGGGDSILNVGQKWRHTWEDSIYPRPSLWITYMYTTAKLFPHLALSGQCIVDCQQCTVGSSPVVGLRRLHVSVDHDVGSFP